MRAKLKIIGLITLYLISHDMLKAQGESMDQITFFSTRFKNPVEVDLRNDQNKIYFNVINKSYFPYDVEVKFDAFRNLSPVGVEKRITVFPGTHRLYTFQIEDPSQAPVLMYSFKYSMAATDPKAEPFKSYLIPIGANKKVRLDSAFKNGVSKIYLNKFIMNSGDTVFNSRKGIVTALPESDQEIDRVFKYNSLEIRHDDGTIAVYFGLDPHLVFISLGEQVYPGQPLGIVSNLDMLSFYVFVIKDDGKVNSPEFFYSDPNGEFISASRIRNTIVGYNKSVITKEMTKKENSKFNKGTLY